MQCILSASYSIAFRESLLLALNVSLSPIKDSFDFLSKKPYPHCLVLVDSRNKLERDLHSQRNACFTIELK